jgi:hypothetical protein
MGCAAPPQQSISEDMLQSFHEKRCRTRDRNRHMHGERMAHCHSFSWDDKISPKIAKYFVCYLHVEYLISSIPAMCLIFPAPHIHRSPQK